MADNSGNPLSRLERTFQGKPIVDRLKGWRAIVGPRADQLGKDAQAAREKLIARKDNPSLPLPTPQEMAALEQAIRLQRPAPWCRFGAVTPLPAEGNWLSEEWNRFQPRLLQSQGSIARLERVENSQSDGSTGRSVFGTGFLVAPDLLMTAGHVVDALSFNTGRLEKGQAVADFMGYKGVGGTELFDILEVVALDREKDLGLLRIPAQNIDDQKRPLLIPEPEFAAPDVAVCVIGYPLSDPRNPPGFLAILFGDGFEIKRAAIGEITEVSETRFVHDCSTLGGNSGSPVLELNTGRVCGVHVSGSFLTRNGAVAGPVAKDFLDRALNPDTTPERDSKTAAVETKPDAGDRAIQKATSATEYQSIATNAPQVLEATIPITIRIEIGNVTGPVASNQLTVSSATGSLLNVPSLKPRIIDIDADDDLIETAEGRPEDYSDRKGFQIDFLGDGFEVPFPKLTENQDDLLTFSIDDNEETILHYHNFSLVMSQSRRMCRYSACNVDGDKSRRTGRPGWRYDPRIPKSAQIMKECYGNPPKFSRGHMTRREDPAWGTQEDAEKGNADSMHVTNTVPQIQLFNGGVWLALEDYALQHARQDDMKICVITGPFLEDDDPTRFGIKVPVTFWKIIAFIHDQTGKLCATGYTMSQKSFIGEQEFVFGRQESNQRPIAEIQRRAGISFGPLASLDPLKNQLESPAMPLTGLNQIQFL